LNCIPYQYYNGNPVGWDRHKSLWDGNGTDKYVPWTILQSTSLTQHLCSRFQLDFRPAMSNPNGLLSQNVCHYLDQGRTLNDIILRAAH